MQVAVDFSWVRPDPAVVAGQGLGALVYDKTFSFTQSAPEVYRQTLEAAGVRTAGIHEEDGLEAFSGYDRGCFAARRADATFAPGTVVYYNMGDTPNVAGHEGQITEFARGVGDTTREPIFGAYGHILALRAAQAGSPKVQRLWGVETWHPYVHGNGNPENIDIWRNEGVDLLQMVGDGPLPGTDRNLVFTETWDRQETAPSKLPPPLEGAEDMPILCYNPQRKTMVAMCVGGDTNAYVCEQDKNGVWSPWVSIGGSLVNFVKVIA